MIKGLVFALSSLAASNFWFLETTEAAEIKILTARALATVLEHVGPDFERKTGHKLKVDSGFGPDFIKRINSGEAFDVFVTAPALIDLVIKSGKVAANTRTSLVRSGTGVAVKAGAPKPDISSTEAFKQVMLKAKSIGYLKIAGVPQLMERLGIADTIKAKVVVPETDIVSELVSKGELQYGVVVTTQILTTAGVDLVGPLPSEIQIYIPFVAGISATSSMLEASRALLDYLKSPDAAKVIKAQGMEAG